MCSAVDPYVSGSNSLDKTVGENSDVAPASSSDSLTALPSGTLAVAASSAR